MSSGAQSSGVDSNIAETVKSLPWSLVSHLCTLVPLALGSFSSLNKMLVFSSLFGSSPQPQVDKSRCTDPLTFCPLRGITPRHIPHVSQSSLSGPSPSCHKTICLFMCLYLFPSILGLNFPTPQLVLPGITL